MPLLDRESREQLKTAHRVGAVGIELVLAILVGWYGGKYLDGVLGTTPWLGYVGFLFGVFAGFRGLAHIVRRTNLDAL